MTELRYNHVRHNRMREGQRMRFGERAERQMVEFQRRINELRALRSDLSEALVVEKIQWMASGLSLTTIQCLDRCKRLAILGEPMPWEDSHHMGLQ